jgi:HAD superfamily hydrolase (TIGR01509 family)
VTPKYLFLDFDGTLVDTLGLLYQFYLSFLAGFGQRGSRQEFEELNGCASWEVMQRLRERYGLQPTVEQLLLTQRARLLQLYATQVHLFPGAAQFLEHSRQQGLRLLLVTSANRELVEAWLQVDQAGSLFDAIITPEGLRQAKPHPAIYLRALQVAGIGATEALVIEDALHGLQAALGAGIPTVAFLRPETYPFELPKGLYGVVHSWEELENLLALRAPC